MCDQIEQKTDYDEMRNSAIKSYGDLCAGLVLDYGIPYDELQHTLSAMFEVFELTGSPDAHERDGAYAEALSAKVASEEMMIERLDDHGRDA